MFMLKVSLQYIINHDVTNKVIRLWPLKRKTKTVNGKLLTKELVISWLFILKSILIYSYNNILNILIKLNSILFNVKSNDRLNFHLRFHKGTVVISICVKVKQSDGMQ